MNEKSSSSPGDSDLSGIIQGIIVAAASRDPDRIEAEAENLKVWAKALRDHGDENEIFQVTVPIGALINSKSKPNWFRRWRLRMMSRLEGWKNLHKKREN